MFWSLGAYMAVERMNLGPLLPSSIATYGTVGAGGNSVELVPYLRANPDRAAGVFKCFKGLGRASSVVG